ncbi:hypothetical protein [Tenacibaculum agarivorans]|uniref:hypothetical protein n=1 Tax=Tenacibaculum agarivorans TaxID=1908389 RepID=UPI00094BB062|nr:hypothetical protein [Tenacibaculum agarivorans]
MNFNTIIQESTGIINVNGTFVPGKLISKEEGEITFKLQKENSISLPEGNYPKLLPPTIVANLISNDNEVTGIRITGVILVDNNYDLTTDDFGFCWNFTYGSTGGYQLNLYAAFEAEAPKSLPSEYDMFGFEVNFKNEAIKSGIFTLPLEKIKTVEAFVVDADPETSRGTVTTVKSGDRQ